MQPLTKTISTLSHWKLVSMVFFPSRPSPQNNLVIKNKWNLLDVNVWSHQLVLHKNAFKSSAVRPTTTTGGATMVLIRSATLMHPQRTPNRFSNAEIEWMQENFINKFIHGNNLVFPTWNLILNENSLTTKQTFMNDQRVFMEEN